MPNKIVPGNKPGHHIAIHMPNPKNVHVIEIPNYKKKSNIQTRKNRKLNRRSRKNRKSFRK